MRQIAAHGDVSGSIHDAIDEIANDVETMLRTLEGEETGGATLPGAPPLARRVSQLYFAVEAATSLPTVEQRQLTRRSHEDLGEQIASVDRLVSKQAAGTRATARRGRRSDGRQGVLSACRRRLRFHPAGSVMEGQEKCGAVR